MFRLLHNTSSGLGQHPRIKHTDISAAKYLSITHRDIDTEQKQTCVSSVQVLLQMCCHKLTVFLKLFFRTFRIWELWIRHCELLILF